MANNFLNDENQMSMDDLFQLPIGTEVWCEEIGMTGTVILRDASEIKIRWVDGKNTTVGMDDDDPSDFANIVEVVEQVPVEALIVVR
jgi:hypothetical protein